MKGAEEGRRPAIVRTALECIYVFSHFLAPVIPLATELIFERLNTPPRMVHQLQADFYNLKPHTVINFDKLNSPVLFQKLQIDEKKKPIVK